MAFPDEIYPPLFPAEADKYREDYVEAHKVLSISPKASAALSRRCLQRLLTDQGFTQRDLSRQIDDLLASEKLPSDLGEHVDSIRNIGNFAAHEQKSTQSGMIMDVEPHEAEWTLEVLMELFDHFLVKPAARAAKSAALEAKLKEAGKPPMKKPAS